jgi:Lon-like ATP-dependent protease
MARRAFFCSDASDGSDQVVEVEAKATGAECEAEAKASSAIVSTNPRPEDYLTVGYSLAFVAHSIQSMKLVIVN